MIHTLINCDACGIEVELRYEVSSPDDARNQARSYFGFTVKGTPPRDLCRKCAAA